MTNILETFKEQLNDEEFINEFWAATPVQLKGDLFNYFGDNEVYSLADCNLLVEEILVRCQNLDSNLDINHDHSANYDEEPEAAGEIANSRGDWVYNNRKMEGL